MQQDAPSLPPQPRRAHLYDIDCGKGLVIPFVVFTHLTLRGNPEGNEWYDVLRTAFGNFEMPMFVYMSGLVMFYSLSAFIKPQAYPSYLRRRAVRFMLPYALIGLAVLLGKAAASRFIFVDNAASGFMDGLSALFWKTDASPASSLWYIYVMFLFCVIVPPLLWLTKGRIWPLLVLGVLMYPLPWPGYMFLDKAGIYFVFLMLGGLAAMHIERWQVFLDRYAFILIGIFLLSFALMLVDMDPLWRMAVIGPLSLPALHAFVRLPGIYKSRLLLFLGAYCYVIYLFNTIFIGVTKGVMFHIMSWDGPNFLIFAPILFLAGILGPVLLKRLVFKHNKFLDTMTA